MTAAGFAKALLSDDSTLRFSCFSCQPGPVRAGLAALRRHAPEWNPQSWKSPQTFGGLQREALRKAAEAAGSLRDLLAGRGGGLEGGGE